MDLNQTIFLCALHTVTCAAGMLGCYFVYKWKLAAKISFALVLTATIFYIAAAQLVYNEFSIGRLL